MFNADIDNIGTVIKKIRCRKKMSQELLSKGLCSRKQLSRIEHNRSNPSSYLLKEFSYRLGENIYKYAEFLYCEDPISMYELVNELEFLFSEMDYSLIRQKIECIDKSLPEYNCLLSKQIIGWYTYMAHFNLRINDYSSLKLKELFEYTTNLPLEFVEGEHYSKYEIRIIYSYALYCCSIGDAHISKRIISKLISYINEYCYDRDLLILTRLYHKYAHMLMDNQRFKEALEMINLGQGLIVNKSNLLLLSDFIYSKGTCYEHMGFDKKSLKLYARALSLRNTVGNETYT